MHLPAAEGFRVHRLAGGHFNQARARHRHDRALAEHAKIRQRRIPRRRTVAMPQHRRRPRILAHAHVLERIVLGADGIRAHHIGHARAGGFAEEHRWDAAFARGLFDVLELLDVDVGAGRALHREVIGDDGGLTPVDAAEARHLAIGRRVGFVLQPRRHREQAGLDERAGIEQSCDAFACVKHTGSFTFGEFFLAAHGQCFLFAGFELLQAVFKGHGNVSGLGKRGSLAAV